MIEHIIVTGPQGCGKTRNAERIRKHFGCANVIEMDSRVSEAEVKALAMREKLLLLTCEPKPMKFVPRQFARAKVVQFHSLPDHCRA